MKLVTSNQAIYVSSSCVRQRRIGDSVRELVEAGFRNIELSGGTQYYSDWLSDLLELQAKYGLNYRCHNYFPPPQKHFVLNLSSCSENRHRTIAHLSETIKLSAQLGACQFGVHAGFRIDPRVDELGQKITSKQLLDKAVAERNFLDSLALLNAQAKNHGIQLYVENNVLSLANYLSFDEQNPFLLTHSAEFDFLSKQSDLNLLLDVAHLKVSCHSLSLDFEQELAKLIDRTDYVHVSDNNGLSDSNSVFTIHSKLFEQLRQHDLNGKTFTLEIYSNIEDLALSYQVLNDVMKS